MLRPKKRTDEVRKEALHALSQTDVERLEEHIEVLQAKLKLREEGIEELRGNSFNCDFLQVRDNSIKISEILSYKFTNDIPYEGCVGTFKLEISTAKETFVLAFEDEYKGVEVKKTLDMLLNAKSLDRLTDVYSKIKGDSGDPT
jgi:flagellar motility protein MotE (MotC chaperone)